MNSYIIPYPGRKDGSGNSTSKGHPPTWKSKTFGPSGDANMEFEASEADPSKWPVVASPDTA